MFSSFLQYLCLAPSFTNVLNVYAFCNLHDVSWGTKGSDKEEALPSVSSSKMKNEETAVVQDTERVQEDLDAVFKETVTRAVTKVEVKEVPEKASLDDQNKTFRTRLVVFWMLTNAGLAIAIENINGLHSSSESVDEENLRKKQNIYFAFILYSTFGLSAVRFIGVRKFCLALFPSLNIYVPFSAFGTSSNATSSDALGGREFRPKQSFVLSFVLSFLNHTMDFSAIALRIISTLTFCLAEIVRKGVSCTYPSLGVFAPISMALFMNTLANFPPNRQHRRRTTSTCLRM